MAISLQTPSLDGLAPMLGEASGQLTASSRQRTLGDDCGLMTNCTSDARGKEDLLLAASCLLPAVSKRVYPRT